MTNVILDALKEAEKLLLEIPANTPNTIGLRAAAPSPTQGQPK